MRPLRGNVPSTVHCRTGLQQRLEKTVKAYRVFFYGSFPREFCLCLRMYLYVFNICLAQINLIHFVNGFTFSSSLLPLFRSVM